MADAYVTVLSRLILSMEKVYGLSKKNNSGIAYADTGIREIVSMIKNDLSTHSKDEILEMNKSVGKDVILLSYLCNRIRFFSYVKLNYKKYPALKEIATLLISFTKKSTIGAQERRSLNRIIVLLDEMDKKQPAVRVGLAYKYLRMFAIMVMYGNLCNASVLADFILNQFIVKKG